MSSDVEECADHLKKNFLPILRMNVYVTGSVTLDGVRFKVQGKRFYDFTQNYIDIRENNGFEEPEYAIKIETLPLFKAHLFQLQLTSEIR